MPVQRRVCLGGSGEPRSNPLRECHKKSRGGLEEGVWSVVADERSRARAHGRNRADPADTGGARDARSSRVAPIALDASPRAVLVVETVRVSVALDTRHAGPIFTDRVVGVAVQDGVASIASAAGHGERQEGEYREDPSHRVRATQDAGPRSTLDTTLGALRNDRGRHARSVTRGHALPRSRGCVRARS